MLGGEVRPGFCCVSSRREVREKTSDYNRAVGEENALVRYRFLTDRGKKRVIEGVY